MTGVCAKCGNLTSSFLARCSCCNYYNFYSGGIYEWIERPVNEDYERHDDKYDVNILSEDTDLVCKVLDEHGWTDYHVIKIGETYVGVEVDERIQVTEIQDVFDDLGIKSCYREPWVLPENEETRKKVEKRIYKYTGAMYRPEEYLEELKKKVLVPYDGKEFIRYKKPVKKKSRNDGMFGTFLVAIVFGFFITGISPYVGVPFSILVIIGLMMKYGENNKEDRREEALMDEMWEETVRRASGSHERRAGIVYDRLGTYVRGSQVSRLYKAFPLETLEFLDDNGWRYDENYKIAYKKSRYKNGKDEIRY